MRQPGPKTNGSKNPKLAGILATCLIILSIIAARANAADILLKGGTIIDGTGGKPYQGSVLIHDGHIAAVGDVADAATAKQTIDCKGLIICPGFIDLHNHSDSTILKDSGRSARCYLTQGCTTLITGNCGGGPTDIAKFYDDLDSKGTGINIATLVPQGSVREKVMKSEMRAPTPAELKQMQEIAAAGMEQGAWGISSGLQYIPSAFAKTDELIAISIPIAKHNGFYASHIRDEGDTLIESIEEVIEIAKGAHLPVHVSHLKSSKKPNWGKVRAAAHLIEKAQHEGIKITADQYPYTASSTSIMAMLLPDEEREGGERATAKRLKDEATAKRLRPIIAKGIDARGPIQIASIKSKPEWVGKIITDIAKTENREPVDVALDILRDDPDAAGVNFGMDEADVRFVMTLPWVATASDGSQQDRQRLPSPPAQLRHLLPQDRPLLDPGKRSPAPRRHPQRHRPPRRHPRHDRPRLPPQRHDRRHRRHRSQNVRRPRHLRRTLQTIRRRPLAVPRRKNRHRRRRTARSPRRQTTRRPPSTKANSVK